MVPTDFFGLNIIDVLQTFREREAVAAYSKIEGDEFLKLPEEGFYLQAKNRSGIVSSCRIYFENRDDFISAKLATRGVFSNLDTLADFARVFGPPVKDIRAIKIPGADPTLPGEMFVWDDKSVSVYCEYEDRVSYVQIRG